jgi:hypothetical protein
MKFIRKGGRIIPIKEKKDGQADKRHVSDKKLANYARENPASNKEFATKTALGALFGQGIAGSLNRLTGSKLSRLGGAALGALAGLASATKIHKKQDVANKMLLKQKKKKG